MKELLKNLKGDKGIWAVVALMALFSFMPVFSASSNLAYMNHGTGNTLAYLVKHFGHLVFGFFVMYQVQKIPYNYFKGLSLMALPIVWILLAITMFFGVEQGAATRWIRVPFIGVSFQPSALASLVLLVYVARYLAKNIKEKLSFKTSFLQLWVPVGITLMFILPNNFSTAALIFAMVVMLSFIGNYPLKHIGIVMGMGFGFMLMFYFTAKIIQKSNPDHTPRIFKRVATWEKRADRFLNKNDTIDKETSDDDYQIEKAKTAIASGGFRGLGPGKSVQKNFLPQSSSDFIFAIIVEEYGLIGALGVLLLYLFLFFRFIVAAHKATTVFGRLLVAGLGFSMIFQALINMGVAVQLLPVTGQTLPLISSGGSSIWMTCIAIGIIISVTKKEEEFAQELAEKNKRKVAMEKLIDKQLMEDDLVNPKEDKDYSIIDGNPLQPILN